MENNGKLILINKTCSVHGAGIRPTIECDEEKLKKFGRKILRAMYGDN